MLASGALTFFCILFTEQAKRLGRFRDFATDGYAYMVAIYFLFAVLFDPKLDSGSRIVMAIAAVTVVAYSIFTIYMRKRLAASQKKFEEKMRQLLEDAEDKSDHQ